MDFVLQRLEDYIWKVHKGSNRDRYIWFLLYGAIHGVGIS